MIAIDNLPNYEAFIFCYYLIYTTHTCLGKMQFICVDDYEKEAHKRLPKDALDYYRRGADDELTLRANEDSFKKWKILPRFLMDVSLISLQLEVLGQQVSFPIGASPTAMHKVSSLLSTKS